MYVTYDLLYYFFMYIMYYGIMHNTNIHKKVVQKIISYTKSTCIRLMRYDNWIMLYHSKKIKHEMIGCYGCTQKGDN